jgi:hypothetical protein
VALLARGLPDLTMNGLIDHLPIASWSPIITSASWLKTMRVQPGTVGRRVV